MHVVIAIGVCVGLLASAAPGWAHHAFAAEFDAKKPVAFTGVVTKVEWINPHTWIHVAVKNKEGKVENWMIEGGPPGGLLRRGLNKNSLPVGTQIVVEGYASKDGRRRANGRTLKLPDGRMLFMGSSGTGAPEDGKDPSAKSK